MLIIKSVKSGKVLIASDDRLVILDFIKTKIESALNRIKGNNLLESTSIYQSDLVDRLNRILTEKTNQVIMLESLLELQTCANGCYDRNIQIIDVNFFTNDNKYQLVTVEC